MLTNSIIRAPVSISTQTLSIFLFKSTITFKPVIEYLLKFSHFKLATFLNATSNKGPESKNAFIIHNAFSNYYFRAFQPSAHHLTNIN